MGKRGSPDQSIFEFLGLIEIVFGAQIAKSVPNRIIINSINSLKLL